MSVLGNTEPVTGRNAERLLAGEILQEIRAVRVQFTALSAELSGRVTNDVLLVETITFDTSGYAARQFRAAAGAVSVEVSGINPVTVTPTGATGGGAPTSGVGVYVIPKAAGRRTVPLGSHQLTLYGTAGDTISIVVFAGAVSPVAT